MQYQGKDWALDQEKVVAMSVVDDLLFFACEDGWPNRNSGPWWFDGSTWKRLKTQDKTGYDGTHGVSQVMFDNKIFMSFSFGYKNKKTSLPLAVSSDGGSTFTRIGDPRKEFELGTYSGNNYPQFLQFGGHLFSTGYWSKTNEQKNGGSVEGRNWLIHYTGDADHSFEVVYDHPKDFWPEYKSNGSWTLSKAAQIGDKLILGSGYHAVQAKIVMTQGSNGLYPKPVFTKTIPGIIRDVHQHGNMVYLIKTEKESDQFTILSSDDCQTFETLITLALPSTHPLRRTGRPQLIIHEGDMYLSALTNLYRIDKSHFDPTTSIIRRVSLDELPGYAWESADGDIENINGSFAYPPEQSKIFISSPTNSN